MALDLATIIFEQAAGKPGNAQPGAGGATAATLARNKVLANQLVTRLGFPGVRHHAAVRAVSARRIAKALGCPCVRGLRLSVRREALARLGRRQWFIATITSGTQATGTSSCAARSTLQEAA